MFPRYLRVDRVELYQIHDWDPRVPVEAGMEEMRGSQEEGKTLHIGVSNFTAEQPERAMKVWMIVSNQVSYNLLFREIENDTIPFCQNKGVSAIIHGPLAKGLLTGAFPRSSAPSWAPLR
jgi:aryl-alcohol dehydrogenase-like predicted oxidoreductase